MHGTARSSETKGSPEQYGPIPEFVLSGCPSSEFKNKGSSREPPRKGGQEKKNSSRGGQRLRSRRPRGRAFLDKYRPRAPGGLRFQRPGQGNRVSAGAGEGQRGHVVRPAGAQGCHAARRRAGRAGGGSPRDRQTPTDGQAGSVRKSLPRGLPARLLLLLLFSSASFFLFFLLFFF